MDQNASSIRRLTILSNQNIHALNGAAKFVKLFEKYDKDFEHCGVQVNVFSSSNTFTNETKYRKSFMYMIKSNIRELLKLNYIGSIFSLYYEYFKNAKKIIKQQKFNKDNDLILFNDIYSSYYYFKSNNYLNKTALMMHNDGNIFKMLLNQHPKLLNSKVQLWLDEIKDRVFSQLDYIIFVSETAKENFCLNHPHLKSKALFIPIGIEEKKISECRNYDTLNIITVGTVCRRKNQLSIIKCIHRINDPSIHLVVIGDGEDFMECTKYIDNHHLEKQITMVGSQNDVDKFLAQNNLFVMASSDEGLPISAQEAIRSGLAVVLTNVGGCKELIDGNGILVENEIELQKAIDKINHNKSLLIEYGEKSKEIFREKYTIKIMIENYCKLVKQNNNERK